VLKSFSRSLPVYLQSLSVRRAAERGPMKHGRFGELAKGDLETQFKNIQRMFLMAPLATEKRVEGHRILIVDLSG